MALADMGIAWLAEEIIHQELADQRLVSFAEQLGQVELEIVLYYRDEALSARVGEVIADMEGLK
jgi:DNA-binding transcriptional LysR family regulator